MKSTTHVFFHWHPHLHFLWIMAATHPSHMGRMSVHREVPMGRKERLLGEAGCPFPKAKMWLPEKELSFKTVPKINNKSAQAPAPLCRPCARVKPAPFFCQCCWSPLCFSIKSFVCTACTPSCLPLISVSSEPEDAVSPGPPTAEGRGQENVDNRTPAF